MEEVAVLSVGISSKMDSIGVCDLLGDCLGELSFFGLVGVMREFALGLFGRGGFEVEEEREKRADPSELWERGAPKLAGL